MTLTTGRLIGQRVFEVKLRIGRNQGTSFCPDGHSTSLTLGAGLEGEGEGFDRKVDDNNGLGLLLTSVLNSRLHYGRGRLKSHSARPMTEKHLT